MFDFMHFADVERVNIDTYRLKNVARTLFGQ